MQFGDSGNWNYWPSVIHRICPIMGISSYCGNYSHIDFGIGDCCDDLSQIKNERVGKESQRVG